MVDLLTRILGAGPTPHVFAVTRGLRVLVDGRTDDPHNEVEEEEADCKCGIVNGGLFSPSVAALPVTPEDDNAGKERETGHAQKQVLGPWVGSFCPSRQIVTRRDSPGRIEDSQSRPQQSQHDQTATEVDETKEDLGDADTKFDSLWRNLVHCETIQERASYQVASIFFFGVLLLFPKHILLTEGWAERVQRNC